MQQSKLFADLNFECPTLTEEEHIMLEENDDAALFSDWSFDDNESHSKNNNIEPHYSESSNSKSDS